MMKPLVANNTPVSTGREGRTTEDRIQSNRQKHSQIVYNTPRPSNFVDHVNSRTLARGGRKRSVAILTDADVSAGALIPPTTQHSGGSENTRQAGDGGDESTAITVTDPDGCAIGFIRKINPWHKRMEMILQIAPIRSVQVRRGSGFTESHLDSICDHMSDPEGVGVVACAIQAVGEIMPKPCEPCSKSKGPFESCITLIHPQFPKCGNCEWNGMPCSGISSLSSQECNGGRFLKTHLSNSKTREEIAENGGHWRLLQIKTQLFASPQSVAQCLSWVEDEQFFKHRIVDASKEAEVWGVLRQPVDFHVQLKDISEVMWSSYIVHFRMKEGSSIEMTSGSQPRGDIMITFESPHTALAFSKFCHKKGLKTTEERP